MKRMTRKDRRVRRHRRVRAKVSGTMDRPRMAISISNKHIRVQFIDDNEGRTMAAVSSLGKGLKCNVEGAKQVGQMAGSAATSRGIKNAVVDRGGFKFHKRLQALVAGAEAGGIVVRKAGAKQEAREDSG